MNKCLLLGRLTRNPEVSYTVNNLAVCRFTLAVDRPVKREGQPTADFIGCTAFGKTAETISKYLNKGSKIAIEGRWTTGEYTDKDGNKHYTNACTVERMEFVESKKNADAPANVPPATEPQYVPEGFSELDDDEIPF